MTGGVIAPVAVTSTTRLDRQTLGPVVKHFRDYFKQFEGAFVGRDKSLEFIMYAMAMKEHILVFGPPGTAKTQLSDAVFGGITGAQKFGIELTPFMTDDAVFGPYDVKRMRDEGVLVHRIEGMLPEADYARLGETLDANPALLRSLLGAMHERRFRRGQQELSLPLMSMYCDTNIPPATYLARNPQAEAVIDRILFLDRFDYLESAEELSEMVLRFQRGMVRQATIELPLEYVRLISDIVTRPPGLITDGNLIKAYGAAVAEYRTERDKLDDEKKAQFILPQISDRRVAKASQMLEVSAVLDGRFEAAASDLVKAGIVLCTSAPERELWEKIAAEHADKYEAARVASIEDSQMIALIAMEQQLRQEVLNGTDLQLASHAWRVIGEQLEALKPENGHANAKKHELVQLHQQAAEALKQRAVSSFGLSGT